MGINAAWRHAAMRTWSDVRWRIPRRACIIIVCVCVCVCLGLVYDVMISSGVFFALLQKTKLSIWIDSRPTTPQWHVIFPLHHEDRRWYFKEEGRWTWMWSRTKGRPLNGDVRNLENICGFSRTSKCRARTWDSSRVRVCTILFHFSFFLVLKIFIFFLLS